MKIAFVTDTFYPSTNGLATRLSESIRSLTRQGHEIIVITPDQAVSDFEGAKIYGISPFRFFLCLHLPLFLPGSLLGKRLRKFKPDIVHIVNPGLLGTAAFWLTRHYPLVASYHTHIPKLAGFYKVPWLKSMVWSYLRLLHNRAELNLYTSRSMMKHLTQHDLRNVQIWERGVNIELFHPRRRNEEMRHLLSEGETDKRVLLYVGRLTAEKQIERLRSALNDSGHFRLAIVGEGPHRSQLETYFAGTGTVFTGLLHGIKLAQAFASSDIFVLPSVNESVGLVLLEAMASGLPVVAPFSELSKEQVVHGNTGFLYDPDIREGLMKALLPLLDEALLQRAGEQAREIARIQSWEGPSKQLLEWYKMAVKGQ